MNRVRVSIGVPRAGRTCKVGVRERIGHDVEHDTAALRANLITPVPGGVGPVAVLTEHTIDAAFAAP